MGCTTSTKNAFGTLEFWYSLNSACDTIFKTSPNVGYSLWAWMSYKWIFEFWSRDDMLISFLIVKFAVELVRMRLSCKYVEASASKVQHRTDGLSLHHTVLFSIQICWFSAAWDFNHRSSACTDLGWSGCPSRLSSTSVYVRRAGRTRRLFSGTPPELRTGPRACWS